MSKSVEPNRNPFDWSSVQEQCDASGKVVGYVVPADVMKKLVTDRQDYWDSVASLSSEHYPPPTAQQMEEMRNHSQNIHDLIREIEEMNEPAVAEAK